MCGMCQCEESQATGFWSVTIVAHQPKVTMEMMVEKPVRLTVDKNHVMVRHMHMGFCKWFR